MTKFEAELRARAYWRSGADEDYTVKITRAERDALADAVGQFRREHSHHGGIPGIDTPCAGCAALRRLDGPPEQKETRP